MEGFTIDITHFLIRKITLKVKLF